MSFQEEGAGVLADYQLRLTQDDNIIIGESVIRRLIEGGDGSAALLYLALARRGAKDRERLRAELRWDEARFDAAERALIGMGLLVSALPDERPAPAERPVPAERTGPTERPVPPERESLRLPEYSREDVMGKLESDASFSALLTEVERKLGRLSEPSVRKLLGLYDFLGLPADVIFLLVSFCIDRKERQFGAGRLPTMREIEKEGYVWARQELFSSAAADAYIRQEKQKRRRFPEYMAALRLGDRAPVAAEERYLGSWSEMGFPAETVAIAYEKTVLRCREFKWPYCNGILKRWHEKGLHTPEQVSAENAPARPKPGTNSDNSWMNDYD